MDDGKAPFLFDLLSSHSKKKEGGRDAAATSGRLFLKREVFFVPYPPFLKGPQVFMQEFSELRAASACIIGRDLMWESNLRLLLISGNIKRNASFCVC